jgi:hypothetical protein
MMQKQYWKNILVVLLLVFVCGATYVSYRYQSQKKILDGVVPSRGVPQTDGGIFFPIDDPRHPGGPNYNPTLYQPQESADLSSTTEGVSNLSPVNLESDPHLLGISHNVFIALILDQTGNKTTEIGPRTQYAAEVISNIKGELAGVVMIDQYGGMVGGKTGIS